MGNYDYDYTKIKTGDYNYDYTKFGKADYNYDYNNHCNRLQMITITIVISPMPVDYWNATVTSRASDDDVNTDHGNPSGNPSGNPLNTAQRKQSSKRLFSGHSHTDNSSDDTDTVTTITDNSGRANSNTKLTHDKNINGMLLNSDQQSTMPMCQQWQRQCRRIKHQKKNLVSHN